MFVLSTGRCGSTTVTRAFRQAANYTSGHETRAGCITDRLAYPDDHIESDNRLVWFLGGLEARFGDRAHWIHLTRDPDEVVDSHVRRWEALIARRRLGGLARRPQTWLPRFRRWSKDPTSMNAVQIGPAFAYGIVMHDEPLTAAERRDAVALYVQTVNEQISLFLDGRTNRSHIDLADAKSGFAAAWTAIGARGPLDAALRELDVRHNAGRRA